MKKVFSPIFITVFVVLPQIISIGCLPAILGVSDIKSFVAPAIAILLSCVFFAVYAYTKRKEEIVNTKIFIAISALYTITIAMSILYGSEFFSSNVSVSPKLIFIVLCMVSVIYGIVGIAYNTTPPGKTYDTVKYVLGIVFAPLIWFLGINLVSGVNSNTIILILIIASVYAILFFIIKLLFIWRLRVAPLTFDKAPSSKYYIAVFIIAFCMPLAGLALNQGFSGFDRGFSAGVFGNFSHPLFYIIAALNGLLLLVPPIENKGQRLSLFYLKSVGYAYILYFFTVFLPCIPIGLIGIVFYGLGLLVLAPLLVTVLQGYHLVKEWIILSKAWSKGLIALVFCAGILTLPLFMTATFWGDKANLAVATQYLEQSNYKDSSPVNLRKLQRTLNNIKGNLQVTRGFLGFSSDNTPIISELYTRLILDGKVISWDNVLTLENLFFDAGNDLTSTSLSNSDIVNSNVRLLDAVADTRYDEKVGAYRSWINLKLKNEPYEDNGEYVATFKLPEGAYISNYYLDVLGERKYGLLTDRRAALFIYSKIVNTRKDPGLLHYVGKNTLELRVFPFAANEVRETGFEIIHSQKFNLTFDYEMIPLGGGAEQKEVKLKGAVLLTSAQKSTLKPIERKPKYYFVIDSSKNSTIPWQLDQIQAYTKANNITAAEVIFASYKLQKYTLADMSQAKYTTEGGFNLNMAVSDILRNEDASSFPIIIAVSDNMLSAVLPRSIHSLSGKFPESLYFYALNHNLTLTPYSYEDNKAGYSVTEPIVTPILDYNGNYVLNNDKSELVLTDASEVNPVLTGNQYEDAILLDALQQKELLAGKIDSVELVRASFRSKILTPQTAFMVVETKEQEKELLDLQERFLNNNFEAPTVTLDEPPFAVSIILFALVLLMLKLKKAKNQLKS